MKKFNLLILFASVLFVVACSESPKPNVQYNENIIRDFPSVLNSENKVHVDSQNLLINENGELKEKESAQKGLIGSFFAATDAILPQGAVISVFIDTQCAEESQESFSRKVLSEDNRRQNGSNSQYEAFSYTLSTPKSVDQINELANEDLCIIAVQNERLILPAKFKINDPSGGGSEQPHLERINAFEGWSTFYGSGGITQNVVIAILDTGVDYNHEDLRANMWKDSQGNYGRNFVNGNMNPMDDGEHGTHVAGLAAAVGNNGRGGAGVMWRNSRIMAVKVLPGKGAGSSSNVASGIIYASDNGADVINLSLGSGNESLALKLAIEYAVTRGATVVAAAGNDNRDISNPLSPVFPAVYAAQMGGVISVGAVLLGDRKADFSNFSSGSGYLTLGAPGLAFDDAAKHNLSHSILSKNPEGGLLSSFPGNKYGYLRGTSIATPLVSGAAGLAIGLMRSKGRNPPPELIKNLIYDSGSAGSNLLGDKTLDIEGLAKRTQLAISQSGAVTITSHPQNTNAFKGETIELSVSVSGTVTKYQWYRNGLQLPSQNSRLLKISNFQPGDEGTYYALISYGNGFVERSRSAQVSYKGEALAPVISEAPKDTEFVAGETFTLSVKATGPNLKYQWFRHGFQPIAGATTSELRVENAQWADSTRYRVEVSNVAGTVSAEATASIALPIKITGHPSSQIVKAGNDVSFQTGSDPYQVSIQWYKNGKPLLGENSHRLEIKAFKLEDEGDYKAVFSNKTGSVSSNIATLELHAPPSILNHSQGPVRVNQGGRLSLSVNAEGKGPLSYQWFHNNNLLSGKTSSTLTIDNIQSAQAGNYRAHVTNRFGTSQTNAIQVQIGLPPVIHIQPEDVDVNVGYFRAQLRVSATGGLEYQWRKEGVPIPGATSSELSLINIREDQAGSYDVIVSNEAGSVTSRSAKVTVGRPPQILTQPIAQTVPEGQSFTLSVEADGSEPLTYQWRRNHDPISGATSPKFTVENMNEDLVGSYTVLVESSRGSLTSSPARIQMIARPVIHSELAPLVLKQGDRIFFRASVLAGGSEHLTIQWQKNKQDLGGQTGRDLSIENVKPSDSGLYRFIATNEAGSVISNEAEVRIDDLPIIQVQPISKNLVEGEQLVLSVKASGPGELKYQWRRGSSPVTGEVERQDSTLIINNMASFRQGAYSVEVSNEGGSVRSQPADVKIFRPLTVSLREPETISVQEGSRYNFRPPLTSGSGEFKYQWLKDGVALNEASSSSSLIISDLSLNDSGLYSLKLSNEVQTVTSESVELKVISLPVITKQPEGQVVAEGAMFKMSVEAQHPQGGELTYSWFHHITEIGVHSPELIINNVSEEHAGSYRVRIENEAGGRVNSVSRTIRVVKPPKITTQPKSIGLSVGRTFQLSFTADWGGANTDRTIQWTFNGENLPGQTNSILRIDNAQLEHQGSYRVTISNPAGSVQSEEVIVSIGDRPVITTQPSYRFGKTAVGEALNLSVVAEGPGELSYQWHKDSTKLLGQNSNELARQSLKLEDSGRYWVMVSNEFGQTSSQQINIDVGSPPLITGQSQSQAIKEGEHLTLSVVTLPGSHPTTHYQWKHNGVAMPAQRQKEFPFENIRLDQQGEYSVEVSNVYGSVESAPIEIKVISPPKIFGHPIGERRLNREGRAFLTRVVATGSEPLIYEWYFEGVKIEGQSERTFAISSVNLEHEGEYFVTVSNDYGSVTSEKFFISFSNFIEITKQPLDQTLEPGQALQLSVEATGKPSEFSYRWTKNGIEVGDNSPNLIIPNASFADSGSYTVRVFNESVSRFSSTASVRVVSSPTITQQPQSQNVSSGEVLNLSVTATGSGTLSYQWKKNGANLGGQNKTTLTITEVNESHSGDYTVTVSNDIGNVTSSVAQVSVLALPMITSHPESQNLSEGGTLSLSVQAHAGSGNILALSSSESGQSSLSYQWLFNGQELAGQTSPLLSLDNVKSEQAGRYAAKVTNQAGSVTSQAAQVTIKGLPVVNVHPLSKEMRKGAILTLSVSASGEGPLNYEWLFNEKSVAGQNSATLRIPNFGEEHVGSYRAIIGNEAGRVSSAIANISISDLQAPVFIVHPQSVQIETGESFILTGEATSELDITYQWHRVSKSGASRPIPGATTSILKIDVSEWSDRGEYILRATNEGGSSDSQKARVQMKALDNKDILNLVEGDRTPAQEDSIEERNLEILKEVIIDRTGGI